MGHIYPRKMFSSNYSKLCIFLCYSNDSLLCIFYSIHIKVSYEYIFLFSIHITVSHVLFYKHCVFERKKDVFEKGYLTILSESINLLLCYCTQCKQYVSLLSGFNKKNPCLSAWSICSLLFLINHSVRSIGVGRMANCREHA